MPFESSRYLLRVSDCARMGTCEVRDRADLYHLKTQNLLTANREKV